MGRALFEKKDATTGMRCLIARFDARDGRATPAPLLIDSDVARVDGEGLVDLSTEGLLLRLTGQPKLANAVPVKDPIQVEGTIEQPKVVSPRVVGDVFKLIGHAIAGKRAETVGDADCVGLAARALGN